MDKQNLPSIGIVIVNYNGSKYQNECIESILNSTYQNYRIIIVDNGSTDNSMDMLKEFTDERILCIYNNENLGVASGNNIGIEKSIELKMDYTMLLNNDTILVDDMIEKMVLYSNKYDVVVPKIYYYNTNRLWYAGGQFSYLKCNNIHLNFGSVDENIVYKNDYDYAPTCCMLIKNSVFNVVGLMDEKYFLYFDDVDFCFKLKLKKIKIGFEKDAILYHKVSLSTGGQESKISIYYMNRNRFYFRKKYSKYFRFKAYLFVVLSRKVKYILGCIKNDNNKVIKRAINDYKRDLMGRCDDL